MKKFILLISAVFILIALMFCSLETPPTNNSNDTTSQNQNDNSSPNNSTTKPDSSTTKPDSSTSKPNSSTNESDQSPSHNENIEMMWVTSNGKKYHSKESCSNMNSPKKNFD